MEATFMYKEKNQKPTHQVALYVIVAHLHDWLQGRLIPNVVFLEVISLLCVGLKSFLFL